VKVSISASIGQDLVWSDEPIQVPGIKRLNRGKRLGNTFEGLWACFELFAPKPPLLTSRIWPLSQGGSFTYRQWLY
jgi:hypothetical protein